MRILDYLPNSTADGEGIRLVLFVAGCPHHCKGCHNPESWNLEGGVLWNDDRCISTILNSPYNLTFSGGEPFLYANDLDRYGKYIKFMRPEKTIWIYTGYTFEEIMERPVFKSVLCSIDILVDGQFEESLRNPKLQFRGSSNQRIIEVQKSLKENKVILWRNGNYV